MENDFQRREIHDRQVDATQVVWGCRWRIRSVFCSVLQCVAVCCSMLRWKTRFRVYYRHVDPTQVVCVGVLVSVCGGVGGVLLGVGV